MTGDPRGLRGSPALLVLFLLLPAATLGADTPKAAADATAARFEILLDRPLPKGFAAQDVRWASDSSVYVAGGRRGIFEIPVDDPEAAPRAVVSGQDVRFASRLGLSDSLLFNGLPFGPVGWKSRNRSGGYKQATPMAAIIDLDVGGDRVWMLGARRDGAGRWAPEGAIVWTASVGSEIGDLQPMMYGDDGPGAKAVDDCWFLDLGAVRYLGNDRWVVIPGVQPGVRLFDGKGKLLRSWQSEPLGFADRCDVEEKDSRRLAVDPEYRLLWHYQRRLLDEVLPWDGWPALVIRVPVQGGTRWDLTLLDGDGAQAAVRLPVESDSLGSHLKGDVRGDRVVLLVVEFELPDKPPERAPRLLVLRRLEG